MTEEQKYNVSSIFLLDSLYSEYELEKFDIDEIINLFYHISDNIHIDRIKILDSFCPACNLKTTFISDETVDENLDYLARVKDMRGPWIDKHNELIKRAEEIGIFQRSFHCPRAPKDSTHKLVFTFKVYKKKLIKIGQYPPVADLSKNEIDKYRKLGNEIYQELNRAIGLMSHGIGVGSFVYLRRIIEKHILKPVLENLVSSGELTTSELKESDFKKKIELSKNQLPDFFVKNKKVYSILSKGIHELSENECKAYFPILRNAIEIILDDQIEKIEKDKKAKIIEKELNKINQ